MASCKPWLHANHGRPTLNPYGVILISDGKKRAENTQIWWGWVKIVKNGPKKIKMGINLLGKVQNGIRSTPLYRCFQCENFDTPQCGAHTATMNFACNFGPR